MGLFSSIAAIWRTRRVFLWLLLGSVLVFTGCTAKTGSLAERITAPRVVTPSQCSGWEKLEVKNRSRYALMQQDPRLLVNIDAHNLRGRGLGCWQ